MEEKVATKIGLYFLELASPPLCFAQAHSAIESFSNVEFKSNASLSEMTEVAQSGAKSVLVMAITNRADLATVANSLFSMKKEIRERKVIVAVFMKFESEKVEELLSRSGCNEVLKFDLNAKAFLYKLRRYLKVLEQDVVSDTSFSVSGVRAPFHDSIHSKDLSYVESDRHHFASDFKIGADAMLACGLKAMLKNHPVELIEYDEMERTVSVGIDSELVEFKETVELTVQSENLGLPENFILSGLVTRVDAADEFGKSTVAVVFLLQNSKEIFKKIREALEKRQAEIFSFFKQAKGL